jgi:hypothetical protein
MTGGVFGDCGGVTIRLKDTGIEPTSFNGATESIEKTRDDQLTFANKRAARYGGNSRPIRSSGAE